MQETFASVTSFLITDRMEFTFARKSVDNPSI